MQPHFLSQAWLLSHAKRNWCRWSSTKRTFDANSSCTHKDFCERPICKLCNPICTCFEIEAYLQGSWVTTPWLNPRFIPRKIQFKCNWKMPWSDHWWHQVENGCRNIICRQFRALPYWSVRQLRYIEGTYGSWRSTVLNIHCKAETRAPLLGSIERFRIQNLLKGGQAVWQTTWFGLNSTATAKEKTPSTEKSKKDRKHESNFSTPWLNAVPVDLLKVM